MKRLFLFLLKKYTFTEKERFEVYNVLQEQVRNDYTEQNNHGNLSNGFIEFIMSSDLVNDYVQKNNKDALNSIRKCLSDDFDKSVNFIKIEPRRKKLNSL